MPTLKALAPGFEQTIESVCAEKPTTVVFYKAKLKYLVADVELAVRPLDEIDEGVIDAYTQRRARKISRRRLVLSAASINRELANQYMNNKVDDAAPAVKPPLSPSLFGEAQE